MATTDPNPTDPTDSETYRPIPVDTARRIAAEFVKDWVIILAFDGEFDRTHYTTFAYGTGSKLLVADLADVCLKAIGVALGPLDGPRMTHEDFRITPQATAAKEIGDLKTQVETLEVRLKDMAERLDQAQGRVTPQPETEGSP
jgi:hypothetical protein